MTSPEDADLDLEGLAELCALRTQILSLRDAWRAAGYPMFMGIPDAWYEPTPKYRCTRGHVSTCTLKSEVMGILCLECKKPLFMTFPNDVDGPLDPSLGQPPHNDAQD